jgi:hypothetical protein
MTIQLTDFDSATNGFHFANDFTTLVLPASFFGSLGSTALSSIVIPVDGLCGGMAFAALDYYHSGFPVPTHQTADYGASGTTPPNSSELYKFILERHLNSVGLIVSPSGIPLPISPSPFNVAVGDLTNALAFASKSSLSDSDARAALPGEVAKAIAELSAGNPIPIGLVSKGALTNSHQVVAIGYDDTDSSATQIFIYDNRYPGSDCTLIVSPAGALACLLKAPGHSDELWHTFFVEKYVPARPTYIDWGVFDGLEVIQISPLLVYRVQLTVANFGDASAHADNLIVTLDPDTIDGSSVSLPVQALGTLPPGSTSNYDQTLTFPSSFAGAQITMQTFYSTSSGKELLLPALAPGTTNRIELALPI